MGAYEALWQDESTTFKRLADQFRRSPDALPSDFVDVEDARAMAERALGLLKASGVQRFGLRIHGDAEYPAKLRDARNPVEVLYFRGYWNWLESRCVAVVGTRKPSAKGEQAARQLVRRLVADDWTIVSGLAAGIDTIAHQTAIDCGGRTIAVLGTPLSRAYPRDNKELQERIAERFLVVTQVPVCRYQQQDYRSNRYFFPERNRTMSALTEATIIVEAGETSGTLVQARAALEQGRKLLILDHCFRNPALTWPARFEAKGAIRVGSYEEVKSAIASTDDDR